MKVVILSNGMACQVDDADFEAVAQISWHPNKARQRELKFYAYGKVGGKSAAMHRYIMGAGPDQEVDHRNGDGLDNRRQNLRLCTRSQNCYNVRRPIGASGYIGVFKSKGRWQAAVGSTRSKRIFLGTFDTPEEAARVRDAAALEQYGEFARLNFQVRS